MALYSTLHPVLKCSIGPSSTSLAAKVRPLGVFVDKVDACVVDVNSTFAMYVHFPIPFRLVI